jgi:Xaa-Pro aminopeptidase
MLQTASLAGTLRGTPEITMAKPLKKRTPGKPATLASKKTSQPARRAPKAAKTAAKAPPKAVKTAKTAAKATKKPAARPAATRGAKAAPKAPAGAKKKSEKPAGHDLEPPPALVDFMLRDWAHTKADSTPIPNAGAHGRRRRALAAAFPRATLVIPTGHEKVRANDTYYRFRPGTDFFYLTGNFEPDCVLVIEAGVGGEHRSILFVEPNPGRSDKTFFTDRNKGELWVGPRLGVAESQGRFGVDECRSLRDLDAYLAGLEQARGRPRSLVLRGFDAKVEALVPGTKEADETLAQALSEMRLLKDEIEVQALEEAIASTHRGFDDVIARLKVARSEREVEGVFNLRARVEGNDVGYGTIAAAGHHACVLHWCHNNGPIQHGDLLLLDAGVEGNSLYTADITRTLPIKGTFTKPQRAVYELVLAAQEAAMAEVQPGKDFLDPNRAAMRVLAEGLVHLGIMKVSAEEALRDEHQFYKRYSLHNVSHMLGLDVHDCAHARQEEYKYGKLRPGMVLTIEPGLYFQIDDLTVPEAYRGIGVRIEDDVLVTAEGFRNLSANIPRSVAGVEAWVRGVWAREAAQ